MGKKTKKALKVIAAGAAIAGLAYTTKEVLRERGKPQEVRRVIQQTRYNADKSYYKPRESKRRSTFEDEVNRQLRDILRAAQADDPDMWL